MRKGFDDTRAALDPDDQFVLVGPNGQSAFVLTSSFPQSLTLRETRLDSKIPAKVTILQEDFERLAISDRVQVTIPNFSTPSNISTTWTVLVIDSDPSDPLVDLTLVDLSDGT